jgi:hypothetical protein
MKMTCPQAIFTPVLRRGQRVEKVVVGPLSDPKEPENKAKTLQRRRFQPLDRELKRARRSFSTRWGLLGSWTSGVRILGRCNRSYLLPE